MDGFQLWVNLPRRDKMMKPRYQEVPAASIPTAKGDGFTVRVLAGESHGASAVIDTRTPIFYLHVRLDANASFEQPVAGDFNAFAYVVRGSVVVDGRTIAEDHAILFDREGDSVVLRSESEPAEFLLIGGRPIDEPVARYGPFVMNTEAEIIQAIRDYQNGRFGEIG
jgi:redox-sensitive bicupin YhaK (pirin superfamily)